MRDAWQKSVGALRKIRRPWLRKTLGVLLLTGGALGFLPVLGFWMLPLGLALLAVDFPYVRRLNRRWTVQWGRRRQRLRTGATKQP